MRVARVTNGAFCARSAQSGTDRGAAARFRHNSREKWKLAANSPPPTYTHLSLPLERERLHARGGARKGIGSGARSAPLTWRRSRRVDITRARETRR